MSTSPEYRKAFIKRLTEACDSSSVVPLPYQGRQTFIAQRLNVSNESVNKWFKGVSMPKHEKMEELAKILGVDRAWLGMGLTPEMDREARVLHGRSADGAVNLVYGMMTLSGVNCGMPSKTDPRAEYVDFYAIARGAVYPIRVILARETGAGTFEMFIPKEHKDVRMIGVINLGGDRYHFIDMDGEAVSELMTERTPLSSISMVCDTSGTRYSTDKHTWPRIRVFSEMT